MSVEYVLKENGRARHVRVTVHEDGRVLVTKPKRASLRTVEAFVREKASWILEMQEHMVLLREKREKKYGTMTSLPRLRRGTAAYKAAISEARAIARERVLHFAQLGNFTYGTISIRNQKSRWGSCSAAGNLSFNYRLIHIPTELVDYLIVHELAHTKHHNHSAAFWEEVGKYIPEHMKRRKELQKYRW
ncbi:MAG: putative metal-dependent hydrolase [Parcubacteria group bacterium]|nr:putative metal-dependent hydrolase [Parcubacteria group bacterium]